MRTARPRTKGPVPRFDSTLPNRGAFPPQRRRHYVTEFTRVPFCFQLPFEFAYYFSLENPSGTINVVLGLLQLTCIVYYTRWFQQSTYNYTLIGLISHPI